MKKYIYIYIYISFNLAIKSLDFTGSKRLVLVPVWRARVVLPKVWLMDFRNLRLGDEPSAKFTKANPLANPMWHFNVCDAWNIQDVGVSIVKRSSCGKKLEHQSIHSPGSPILSPQSRGKSLVAPSSRRRRRSPRAEGGQLASQESIGQASTRPVN